jgi:hypothetical protein
MSRPGLVSVSSGQDPMMDISEYDKGQIESLKAGSFLGD